MDKRGLPHTSPTNGGNKHVNGIVQERKLITLIPLNVTNENVILTEQSSFSQIDKIGNNGNIGIRGFTT